MKSYAMVFSRGAREDMEEIAEYIAERSSAAIADRFIVEIVKECESLCTAPHRGTSRTDLRPKMRVIGYKRKASIVFRIEEDRGLVVILAVNYHGRSYRRLLKRNE
jgi:plasmid stabilization system protein ParE